MRNFEDAFLACVISIQELSEALTCNMFLTSTERTSSTLLTTSHSLYAPLLVPLKTDLISDVSRSLYSQPGIASDNDNNRID